MVQHGNFCSHRVEHRLIEQFPLLQDFLLLRQGIQQPIKTTHQLTHFVVQHHGQGLWCLIFAHKAVHGIDGRGHGRQLAAQHPPDQGQTKQEQRQTHQPGAWLDGLDQGKSFFGWKRDRSVPMGQGNLLHTDQQITVFRINHPCRALKSLNEAIYRRAHTKRRQHFKQARRLGRSKNQSLACIHQEKITGLAVAMRGQLTQKIDLIQPHHTCQSAEHITRRAAYGHSHGKPGRFQLVVDLYLANDDLPFLKHPRQLPLRKGWGDQHVRHKLHIGLQHPLPVP